LSYLPQRGARSPSLFCGDATTLDTRTSAIQLTQSRPTTPIAQRRHRDPGPKFGGPRDRANDALTNLSMYALTLDAEYHRLDDRLLELANTEPATAELGTVLRERDEIAAERVAFRYAVVALREQLPLGTTPGR
jgi:hypothetical protein